MELRHEVFDEWPQWNIDNNTRMTDLMLEIRAGAEAMSQAFQRAGAEFSRMLREAFPLLSQASEAHRAEVRRVHTAYRNKRKGRW